MVNKENMKVEQASDLCRYGCSCIVKNGEVVQVVIPDEVVESMETFIEAVLRIMEPVIDMICDVVDKVYIPLWNNIEHYYVKLELERYRKLRRGTIKHIKRHSDKRMVL